MALSAATRCLQRGCLNFQLCFWLDGKPGFLGRFTSITGGDPRFDFVWIVELALKRPHTFIVMAITIVMFGVLSIRRMAIDIFPVIDVPVVSCVWSYIGMSPYDMENLVTTVTERALTSTIDGIEHMDSISLAGMSIIKLYLHKGTDMGQAVAMVTSVGSAVLRQLPTGISPPFVTESSATDVPVLQLGFLSKTLSESELFDIANNIVRSQLATVQGASIPLPYGGKFRQIMIDLDPVALTATGLSAYDVTKVINAQSLVAPCGTAKLGRHEYIMLLNNIPGAIDQLNDMPVKSVNESVVFVRDVAQVHDGYQPQLNVVNIDGRRAVLLNVLKGGDASTLSVVDRVKTTLKRIQGLIPKSCEMRLLTDQSIFVRECVEEVIKEALIAAVLTALMMLALLGSWRSTIIVATSIPLAILASFIGLNIMGQTINSMTLGGMALAVGMLVDDATVAIENIHTHLEMGKDIVTAILEGAEQVAMPALVSTMSICIVFVPVLLLTEPSRSLFVPLGMAVVFAMMASYGLSRTIVPLMSKALLRQEGHLAEPTRKNAFAVVYQVIDRGFNAARNHYQHLLNWSLDNSRMTVAAFLAFYVLSFCLLPFIGADYFPYIDAGQMRLHVSAPPGTRVEETERLFRKIEHSVAKLIPSAELQTITDNIGLPVSGLNYAFSDSQTISEADGDIFISLTEKRSRTTSFYQKEIRRLIDKQFPQCTAYFQPADIVTQILNAGLPAPIDIKITGFNKEKNYDMAQQLKRQMQKIPGAVDVCLHQVVNAPHIRWNVDRTLALQAGITQEDVSRSFLISLSSSFQTLPNFWLDKQKGFTYYLASQTPQAKLSNIDQMRIMPITGAPTKDAQPQPTSQLLTNLADFVRSPTPSVVNHLNVQPAYDIYAACQDRDLAGVSKDIGQVVDPYIFSLLVTQTQPTKLRLKKADSSFERLQIVIDYVLNHPAQLVKMGSYLLPVMVDFQLCCQNLDMPGALLQLNKISQQMPHGTFVSVGGQVMSMNAAFAFLIAGLVFALLLVYLLLVVNFQSWSDPLIILMAIPGAFSGIVWSLFVTQTTFSIPALMGTIMTVGVASANSILMITFANERMDEGDEPKRAALNAGYQRFRPVIMTATAMIIGMIPMAIGSGQGGSQNAPIGRAVIGGLTVATFSTLVFVPLMFSLFRKKWPRQKMELS